MDNTGVKIKEFQSFIKGSTSIDIYILPVGIYTLIINTKAGTQVIKFIKE